MVEGGEALFLVHLARRGAVRGESAIFLCFFHQFSIFFPSSGGSDSRQADAEQPVSVSDFVRRAEVKGSRSRKEKGSESGEGGVKEKWREGVERGHPR